MLKQLQAKRPWDGDTIYYLSREFHEDGDEHRHAFIKYARKFNCKDASHFDLDGPDDTTYHPNIQAARSPAKVKRYVIKDGDYISNEEDQHIATVTAITETDSKRHAYLVFKRREIPSREWKLLLDIRDEERASRFRELDYNFERREWMGIGDGWIGGGGGGRPKALYLWGAPETGKSSWIYSVVGKDAFYVAEPKAFCNYKNQKYIVLDEFEPEVWKMSFLKKLVTDMTASTPAYYGVKRLAWPRKVIFASNYEPPGCWDMAMMSRIIVVNTD